MLLQAAVATVVLILFSFSLACTTIVSTTSMDRRFFSIYLIDLFNQREPSLISEYRWAGDWIYRRLRLAEIDRSLRSVRPDMILFQEMLARRGSPSESDREILAAGALAGYDWRTRIYTEHSDTLEQESLAVAIDRPLLFVSSKSSTTSWTYGETGVMVAELVQVDGGPVAVFNLRLPTKMGNRYLWYTAVLSDIKTFLDQESVCAKRLLLAGYMPEKEGSERYRALLEGLDLRDSSDGFCAANSSCFTETTENELYLSTSSDRTSKRSNKILVPRSARVWESSRSLDQPSADAAYVARFGLRELWPVRSFAWTAKLTLAECSAAVP